MLCDTLMLVYPLWVGHRSSSWRLTLAIPTLGWSKSTTAILRLATSQMRSERLRRASNLTRDVDRSVSRRPIARLRGRRMDEWEQGATLPLSATAFATSGGEFLFPGSSSAHCARLVRARCRTRLFCGGSSGRRCDEGQTWRDRRRSARGGDGDTGGANQTSSVSVGPTAPDRDGSL